MKREYTSPRRRTVDRVLQAAFIIGVYDLAELIFEDIFLWMIVRKRRAAGKRHNRNTTIHRKA